MPRTSPVSRLRALVARLDERARSPAEWLRAGWPRPLPLAWLAMLPLAVAGPVRAMTGMPMEPALAAGAAALLAILALFWPSLRAGGRAPLAAHLAVAVSAAWAAILLYNGDFDGLSNYGGGDGGAHLFQSRRFVKTEPGEYVGFVSMYGVWDAVVRLTGDEILAVKLTTYLGLVVVGAAPCVVAAAVLHRHTADRRALLVGLAALVTGWTAIRYAVTLPAESFHHLGGFWAHVFGLLPLVGLWWVDALVRHRVLRVAAIAALAVLYRYTYGLNLPDVLGAIGVIFAAEGLGAGVRASLRAALCLLGAAALYGSLHAYGALAPRFQEGGWILNHDIDVVVWGLLLGVAALALTAIAWPARGEAAGSGILRAVRFPLLFGAASVLYLQIIARIPPKQPYYHQKYSLHAIVLISCGLAVALAFWAALAARPRWRSLVALGAFLAVAAASQVTVRIGLEAFQAPFREHAWGGPYRMLGPLYEPVLLPRVRAVLSAEKKDLGGYLSRNFPRYTFTNALFGLGGQPFWYNRSRQQVMPGKCLFWERTGYPRLDKLSEKRCVDLDGTWPPENRPRSLCWVCP